MLQPGPFYDSQQAAEYCGYANARAFAKALKRKGITLPKRGFGADRYAKLDLDILMNNPDAYRQDKPRRRKSAGFTPVAA